jgi:RTX calcium-binding nonapeptide repeat (4 copies)
LSPDETQVSLSAASGKVNDVQLVVSGSTISVADPGDVIDEAVAECNGDGTNSVGCAFVAPVTFVSVDVGDLDDSLRATTDHALLLLIGGDGSDELTAVASANPDVTFSDIRGDDANRDPTGDGNDTLVGLAGGDSLDGGGGTDALFGGEGADGLRPGPGDGDRADGGPGDDGVILSAGEGTGEQLDGGEGVDTLSSFTGATLSSGSGAFQAFSVDLAAGSLSQTAGGTAVASATSFESFAGDGSVFTLTGTDGPNELITGAADDLVNPRAGPDLVRTRRGADRVLARDGFGDRIDCGPDQDAAVLDQFDETFDCEDLDVAQVLPAGVELDAPACTLTGVRRTLRRKRFLRGLRPAVECNEAVTMEARLTVPVRRRRGRLVTVRAGQLVLAEQTRPLATGAQRMTLRVPRRLRTVLGPRFTATLSVVARDQFGNPGRITRAVRIR